MYPHLLVFHSWFRWLVLVSLIYATSRAATGYLRHRTFTRTDNLVRHGTATIAHIQLIVGIVLYIKSPAVRYLWSHAGTVALDSSAVFFGLVHFGFMFGSVVLVTLGSAFAKRKSTNPKKFKTMLVWFGLALFIILIAIPWPFSPVASRPYFRTV